jgi:putative ABC transport system permease protein
VLFSWRLLGRELRSGELRLLFAALAVAVAAVTAVGFFTDRVHSALEQQAQQLMGGDLLLIADHPWPASVREKAASFGLDLAETQTFPSMVLAGGEAQLSEIKAVSSGYPLRGELHVAQRLGDPGQAQRAAPAPGSVWLDERLAAALRVGVGDTVQAGQRQFPVAAIITLEPDRGFNVFSLSPRLMMHVDDLPSTGLVQFGSRVNYRLLLAGDAGKVAAFRQSVEAGLSRGERLEDASNARPEIRNALDRAQRFLGLATLSTVVLSAVAVALAARRYMQRHLDACAVMRCLGMTQGRLVRLHVALFGWLAGLAALAGCLLGLAVHGVLVQGIAGLLAVDLPLPGLQPLFAGVAVAAVLLFGFALPPLLQLARVPTLRVLRRELGAPRPALLGGYAFGLLALVGLMIVVAGDLRLGLVAAGGFTAALAVFALAARATLWGIAHLRRGGGFGWRQGLVNLQRHRAASVLQIVALALGLMALLLLTATRGELLAAWQKAAPPDAPNRFVINIQPEEKQRVADFLAGQGIGAELSPMIRARLTRVNGQPVSAASYPDDERAQRLVEREFNLSWRAALPAGNRVTGGRWFQPEDAGQGLASVEEGLAKTLGVKLGDELLFTVAGRETTLKVSSLRKLDWDSMRVNFFVLAPPGVLDDAPASYITSFHLPAGENTLTRDLTAAFPALTVIDVAALLGQLQAIIDQVVRVVQFVFLFTLAAGGIVLGAALFAAFDERRYELALLRALGARRRQLAQALFAELAVTGALAGLVAALGASAVGQVLARQVLQLDLPINLYLPLLAAAGGALLSVSIGWLAARSLLDTPPLLALRAGV